MDNTSAEIGGGQKQLNNPYIVVFDVTMYDAVLVNVLVREAGVM